MAEAGMTNINDPYAVLLAFFLNKKIYRKDIKFLYINIKSIMLIAPTDRSKALEFCKTILPRDRWPQSESVAVRLLEQEGMSFE